MLTEPQSGKSYSYTSENLLSAASGGGTSSATLTYDPLMRLYQDQPASGAVTRFAYDGMDMIAEYDGSNALQKRTVFGAGTNEPLVQYDAAGNRTWLTADERGSIVALSDDSGTVTQVNRYDEYGKPQPGNAGRFQYTGQAWLDDLGTAPASGQGLYYYRSRMYAPHLGRFMQTDPIGYAGGLNLYAYVLNDPVNLVDPLGLQATGTPEGGGDGSDQDPNSVTVVGCRGLLLYGICSHIAFDLSSLTQPQVNFGFGFGLSSVGAAAGHLWDTLKTHRTNPACTSGRWTLGGQFSATGFLASFGLSGNVEVGVALPTRLSTSRNPLAGVQVYARAQGLGLAGLGFFAGAGVSGVGGVSGSALRTGVQTTVVAQGGFADPAGGEASVSLDGGGASVSGGPRAGMGGYLAGGAGKTATLATKPLGCP